MKRTHIASVGLLAIAAAITGCGKSDTPAASAPPANTHEAIRMQAVTKMSDIIGVFKTITDEASAKAAAPKFDAIGKDFAALKAQDDKLPKMSPEEELALNKKLQEKGGAFEETMKAEMMRISALGPAVMAPVEAAFSNLEKQMP